MQIWKQITHLHTRYVADEEGSTLGIDRQACELLLWRSSASQTSPQLTCRAKRWLGICLQTAQNMVAVFAAQLSDLVLAGDG
jgi:hypothetical protein